MSEQNLKIIRYYFDQLQKISDANIFTACEEIEKRISLIFDGLGFIERTIYKNIRERKMGITVIFKENVYEWYVNTPNIKKFSETFLLSKYMLLLIDYQSKTPLQSIREMMREFYWQLIDRREKLFRKDDEDLIRMNTMFLDVKEQFGMIKTIQQEIDEKKEKDKDYDYKKEWEKETEEMEKYFEDCDQDIIKNWQDELAELEKGFDKIDKDYTNFLESLRRNHL